MRIIPPDSRYTPKVEAASLHGRAFRYYDFIMAASVLVLALSNVIGAAKPTQITLPFYGTVVYGAGIFFFPISYIIGDVLTEVYGYARARRCIWAGFVGLAFMVFMASVVVALPAAAGWQGQAAYESVFGQSWRIASASLLAFWAGDFVNCYVLARMKSFTQGKMLWSRTIGSTFCGQAVDSVIFYPLAFLGVWSNAAIVSTIIVNWALKVGWEVLLTPVTYAVVRFLKTQEGVDVYDETTQFTPFSTAV
jgi:queuosine precursor transporter